MNKFPWMQYGTTLAFYLLIAVAVVIVASILPKKEVVQPTQEQIQAFQQQQQVEQTKLIYQRVLSAVGSLMMLPNELPQISVVQDPIQFVRQNPVFAGTNQGDIVLLYSDKVIIYSPTTNRVVHVEAITRSQQKLSGTNKNIPESAVPAQPSPAQAPEPTQPASTPAPVAAPSQN